ncbi:cytochrome P450 [Aspergillus avenaceus]|uniref:Cytochrome P450 n=1 Tax=Aspergillus avenaceus TaxID=36643 RepID=A0A5N6TJN3_ASPAV|nr:cytochrome P450 [Aspergillus avenaceus]
MLTRMILLAIIPWLAFHLYQKLRHIRTKQHAAWPQLKPSVVWGHLQALHEVISQGEAKRHIDIVFSEIRAHLGHPAAYILDLRPVQRVLCVVCSHDVAEQVSCSSKSFPYSMGKSPTLREFELLLGAHSIIAANGEEWKSLRKRFNPGFAPQHLVKLLPCVVDKVCHFVENLDRYARSGEEFALEDLCVSLTFDIIGAVTMDENLNAQRPTSEQSELVQLYRQLTATYRSDSSVQYSWLNPRITLYRRRLAKRIDKLIKEHIQRKFTEQINGSSPSRSVLALSLQDLNHLDQQTLDQTCDQLKTFLFAGHDTTSILLQWTLYELSRTPHARKAVRDELESLFGPDTSPAAVRHALLSQGEALGKMPYVSAVIKETLRLYPPTGSARYLPPGSNFNIQLSDGKFLCVDGMVVYNCHTIIQRDEAIYGPTKDEFLPERWLDTGDSNATDQIPPSAWRAFERGPRNCIGQELAMMEARVVLACVVRRFDFVKVGLKEVFNTMQVTAKPVDGMRMRVCRSDS